ncbi:hypothetical protein RI367_004328 [Sorochytrium milnesiophthora]
MSNHHPSPAPSPMLAASRPPSTGSTLNGLLPVPSSSATAAAAAAAVGSSSHLASTSSPQHRTNSPASSVASSSGTARKPLSNSSAHQRLLNPPTVVEYATMKFVIMDAPSDSNLALYIKELEKHNVRDVVRACDPTYSKEPLEAKGIRVHELNFKDGDPPPAHVVTEWLTLCVQRFGQGGGGGGGGEPPAIATHCVAGLGRAPVLVAIALIEAGMANLEAVEYIRSRRRGALNSKQVHYVDTYKRRGKGKLVNVATGGGGSGSGGANGKSDKCIVM